MTDKEIIEMLMKQNERLMQVIEAFASKEIIVNSTVNSYNGSTANADASTTNRNKSEHTDHCNLTTNNNNNGGL